MAENNILGLVTIGLTIIGTVAGIIIYVIRLEGKVRLQEEMISNSKGMIKQLQDDHKDIKEIQRGFQHIQSGFQNALTRIESKQEAAKQSIDEIKDLLKKSHR